MATDIYFNETISQLHGPVPADVHRASCIEGALSLQADLAPNWLFLVRDSVFPVPSSEKQTTKIRLASGQCHERLISDPRVDDHHCVPHAARLLLTSSIQVLFRGTIGLLTTPLWYWR